MTKLETLKADVRGNTTERDSVLRKDKDLYTPDIELPQTKHTHIGNADNTATICAPPSTSESGSGVSTATQATPPTENKSQLPSTSAAVEPAVQEPSPHIPDLRSLNYCHDNCCIIIAFLRYLKIFYITNTSGTAVLYYLYGELYTMDFHESAFVGQGSVQRRCSVLQY